MAYSDYFDEYDNANWDDDWGCEPDYRRYAPPRARRDIQCRLCYKSGLRWGQVAGRWVPYEGDKPHKELCPAEKF
jgi:hypothetical protein